MSKLSPTAIILMISGIGIIILLFFHFSKKKKTDDSLESSSTTTPPPAAADTRQDMPVSNPPLGKMVRTPVGLVRRY